MDSLVVINGELYHSSDFTEDELAHFGVKGMKWGQRKARGGGLKARIRSGKIGKFLDENRAKNDAAYNAKMRAKGRLKGMSSSEARSMADAKTAKRRDRLDKVRRGLDRAGHVTAAFAGSGAAVQAARARGVTNTAALLGAGVAGGLAGRAIYGNAGNIGRRVDDLVVGRANRAFNNYQANRLNMVAAVKRKRK